MAVARHHESTLVTRYQRCFKPQVKVDEPSHLINKQKHEKSFYLGFGTGSDAD